MDAILEFATLEERKEFAQAQGVGNAGAFKLELDVLRTNGLLVDLDISGTSMFSRAATWLELAVLDENTRERFTKGRKVMIPPEVEKKLKSIETRMRQILEKYSYPTRGFYPFRWLPWTAYGKWREEMERLQAEFASVKSEIIANYDGYQDMAMEDFAQIAREAWRKIINAGYSAAILKGAGVVDDEDQFVDLVVSAAVAKMPTVAEIESRLVADYSTALVYGEQDVAADHMAAEIAKAKEKAEAEAAYQQAALLNEENRHIFSMHRMEEEAKAIEMEEKAIAMEAMRQAEIEHARKRIQEVGSPFADVVMQLRNRIAEDCEALLTSIKKNGYLRGKVADKGRGLLEFYNLMAAHSDDELRNLLKRLSEEIGPEGAASSERNPEQIAETLGEIVNLTHISAKDMMTVSQAAFIEI